MRWLIFLTLSWFNGSIYSFSIICPHECDCDTDNGLNRAVCVDQNIVSIDVGVPSQVQVYSLSRNVISELDNYCFKNIRYNSLIILDLSSNFIFWIGLHAFAGLVELTNLDLRNNRLRSISSDLFWETPKLEILDLSSNIFENVKNEPFISHTHLQSDNVTFDAQLILRSIFQQNNFTTSGMRIGTAFHINLLFKVSLHDCGTVMGYNVLNLNNCRIKSVPERLFNRLPNLKKLDLSENYIVTITIDLLKPLSRLERLELRNEYWQCNSDFVAFEAWVVGKNIKYEKQCKRKSLQKSEKIISMTVEKESVDISKVWNITIYNTTSSVKPNVTKALTPIQKFDRDFSAIQAFIIGLEIGLAIGIVGTFLWLKNICSCNRSCCSRPQVRRRRRNLRTEGDIRANLLWNNVITPDLETPPLMRRQTSLPGRSPPFPIYGIAGLQVDAIREDDRAETPPPPYNECRLNI